MATYINGFGGTITFNSVTLDVESWSLNVNADIPDTTTTGSAGWEEHILGCQSFDGSAKAFFDTTTIPHPTFNAGASATILLPVGSSGHTYTGTVFITKVGVENAAKGAVTFNVDFKGTGALTYAT